MASRAMQQFMMQQMQNAIQAKKEKERTQKISDMAPELVGQQAQEQVTSPFIADTFPGEQQPQGLMNIEQEAQPASGLFDMTQSMPERNIAFNQRLLSSGMPGLQKQAIKNLSDMEDTDAPNYMKARTFAIGAPEKIINGIDVNVGKMQRARPTPEGGIKTLGRPYDPRNPYLDAGTSFVNPNVPSGDIPIENRAKAFETASGKSEVTRRDKDLGAASKQIDTFNSSLGLYDEASKAIDNGASVGYMQKFVPSMRASTLALQNVGNRLGLNIISSVTFGALSEKEMSMAMATGLPTDMQGDALKVWLKEKKEATIKLRDELIRFSLFRSGGGTKEQWNKKYLNKGAPVKSINWGDM